MSPKLSIFIADELWDRAQELGWDDETINRSGERISASHLVSQALRHWIGARISDEDVERFAKQAAERAAEKVRREFGRAV